MYSVIFYSTLFAFQDSPSKCQLRTTTSLKYFQFLELFKFNGKPTIPISFKNTNKYTHTSTKGVNWIQLLWLWLSLVVCYSNLFAYFGFEPLLLSLLNCVIQISQQLLPWRPLPSVPPDNRWHQGKSTLLQYYFILCTLYSHWCSVLRV